MRWRFRSDLRSGRGLLLLVACAWLCAEPVSAQSWRNRRPTVRCVRLGVTAIPAGPGEWFAPPTRRRGRLLRFSAKDTVDLYFRVAFGVRGTEAVDEVELRFFDPNEHLYQTIVTPLSADAEPTSWRHLRGHPRSKRSARVARDRKTHGLKLVSLPSFPVAGTHITRHSLYGRWRVEAWPAGATQPCQLRFAIRP